MTDQTGSIPPPNRRPDRTMPVDTPDSSDGSVYVMSYELDLAVRVALATGRPLLLRGDPGSGKSSLAPYVARQRGWRYYEHVVTSRSEPRDLLYRFDDVRRLSDASVTRRPELRDSDYVDPGVLWWAFAPLSAARRGQGTSVPAVDPREEVNRDRDGSRAVVLIDEIDKADPDLPNGLLVPLGSSNWVVTETSYRVHKETGDGDPGEARHLIVITTNEERELPGAFLRRCVVLWLGQPLGERLKAIALEHLRASGNLPDESDDTLIDALSGVFARMRDQALEARLRAPSTAEFLDALHACKNLQIDLDSDEWEIVSRLTLQKPQQPGRSRSAGVRGSA